MAPGGRAFDYIKIDGFPTDHGAFAGIDGWDADGQDATVTVYFNGMTAPVGTEVPETAVVFWEGTLDAGNITANVGYDDLDQISPTEQGYYVFVYSYAGDSRVAPFTSAFDDVLERFYVPGPTTVEPEKPSVVTQADKFGITETEISDTALVQGDAEALEGASLVFRGYFGEGMKCETPTAEQASEMMAAGPVITTDPIAIRGAGYYTGSGIAPELEGSMYWVETLYGPKDPNAGENVKPGEPGWDTILDEGYIGMENECTIIRHPEREVNVSTKLGHSGDQEAGPVVGDDIWDTLAVETIPADEIRDGDYTEVELYIWEDEEDPQCVSPVWVERVDLIPGQAEYTTTAYTTTSAGIHGFVENTYDKDGNPLSKGVCGDPDETVTVSPLEDSDSGGAASGGMAVTGAGSVLGLAGAGLLLTAAGTAGVLYRRKNAEDMS